MKKAHVIRPEFDGNLIDHPLVRLTATIKNGSVTKEFEKLVRVKMKGITDSQAIVLDLNAITFPSDTKVNIDLPITGSNGSKITWVSNKPDSVNAKGVVTRPDTGLDNVTVTLKATAIKGEETQTKEFIVIVTAWTKAEELDNAVGLIGWDLVKGNNTNSQSITDNLVLPKTVGRKIAAVWTTTSSSLDITTGKITRPSYTQGQVVLKVSCKLTQDALTKDINLSPFIISPLPMTDQEVLVAAKNALEPNLFVGANESVAKITDNMRLPFRLLDSDASRATIVWSLVTNPDHLVLASSKYITLSNTAEYTLATITRPSTQDGNQKVSLKADISVGVSTAKVSDVKYFDLNIVANSIIP